MLLTLLKALDTTDLEKVVGNLDMAPIDVDVMLYDAQEAGDIEVDRNKNKIKALSEPDALYSNSALLTQMRKLISYYDKQSANITKTRLEMICLDPMGKNGYLNQDVICTLYVLEHQDDIRKYDITVPKKKTRPEHTFEFYTFVEHQDFGKEAVDNFIKQFDGAKNKK